ncbi:MAG TPA: hypothetical protein PKW95_15210 [bacterium]|nr:hypothetical protein [bacterium]
MNFFFDEHFPPNLARALNILDDNNSITCTEDKGWRGASDEKWIRLLSEEEEKTVIMTMDENIRYKKGITEVWKKSELTTFFFVGRWNHIPMWDRCVKTIDLWKDIIHKAERAKKGQSFKIKINSKKIEELE